MPDDRHIRILMGTRDGAPYLQAQLDSIRAQSHGDWSLWVSDDGSRDDTRAILQRFAEANPGHEVHVTDGPGQGAAANYLSLLARPAPDGALVALADQDDVWLPEKLARGAAALATVPAYQAAAYGTARHLASADLRIYGRAPRRAPAPSFGNALVQNILPGHSLMLNRAALELLARAGRPGGVHHHDWWVYLLVEGAGGRVIFDPRPTVIYRQHHGNLIGSNRGLLATLTRLAKVMRREYAAWVHGNIAALHQAQDCLTPQNRQIIDELTGARRKSGPAWAWRMHRLGLRRQTRASTFVVLLAALLGRV